MARLSVSRPGYISLVVLVETIWVLQRSFGVPRDAICRTVGQLLQARELVLQAPGVVAQALAFAETRGGGFPDALIAALALDRGCDMTWTFDRGASAGHGFELLEPASGRA
jgi:predicted nucleic-acid-binding protein